MKLVGLYTFDTMEALWIDQSRYLKTRRVLILMKNSMVYYGIIALGVIALAAGAYLLKSATPASPHHISSYAALAAGVVLLIAGVIGMVVMKPKTASK